MAGSNTYAYLPPITQGYIDKRSLFISKPLLVAYDLCEKRTLPEGNGTTVAFWRYGHLSDNTTALTEAFTSQIEFGGLANSTRQQLTNREIYVTPAPYGDWIRIGDYASRVTIDQGLTGAVDVVSQMAAKSIEAVLMKQLSTGLTRMRADNDSTYETTGTTTSAGSTTSIVASALAGANDAWNGGFITITSGAQQGKTRQITDFATGGTITCDAFDVAPGSGVTFKITVGTDIDASDKVSAAAIRRVVMQLEDNDAMYYEGAYFTGVLDPHLKYDFMDDSDFKAVSIYKDNTNNLTTNDVSTFAGVRFKKAPRVYRETVAGVASATGAVRVLPIMGMHAAGCVSLGATPGGRKNFQLHIRGWKELGQPIPAESTIGYYTLFGGTILDAAFGVGLMCGATD
jgi:hypothetical protein